MTKKQLRMPVRVVAVYKGGATSTKDRLALDPTTVTTLTVTHL